MSLVVAVSRTATGDNGRQWLGVPLERSVTDKTAGALTVLAPDLLTFTKSQGYAVTLLNQTIRRLANSNRITIALI